MSAEITSSGVVWRSLPRGDVSVVVDSALAGVAVTSVSVELSRRQRGGDRLWDVTVDGMTLDAVQSVQTDLAQAHR